MKPLLMAAALSLALFACKPSPEPSQTAKKASSSPAQTASISATIAANPNPAPSGGELGETTISWNTGNVQSGEVYVSKNDGAEKLFASGQTGSGKSEIESNSYAL